jgi:REP element-mobilizing transposase RayT
MPQSITKILIHIVFSTKHRKDLIWPSIEAELYAYINGIIENHGCKLIIANGTADHSHFLISIGRSIAVGELIGDMKRGSSKWIKTKGPEYDRFYWQEGYGAFSVGQSQVGDVIAYISRQKEHHGKIDFKNEFRGLMDRYEAEYDERYVWD